MSNDETAAEAANYSKQMRTTFPVLHDPKDAVYSKFGVTGAPANVVIDRKGKVVAAIEGPDLPKLRAAVAKAVAAK